MHVLIEARVIRVYVDDHHSASVTHEVVHKNLSEFAVTEGHQSEAALDIARVELRAGLDALLQATGQGPLVRPKCLHTLAEHHERLVDIAGFAETLARGVRVFRAFRASKIDKRQTCRLDARWVL